MESQAAARSPRGQTPLPSIQQHDPSSLSHEGTFREGEVKEEGCYENGQEPADKGGEDVTVMRVTLSGIHVSKRHHFEYIRGMRCPYAYAQWIELTS